MTPNLTPDQIKAIAREIRDLEAARLGAKLPNTTVLNAVTRSLGLGPDFRTFSAGQAMLQATAPSGSPVPRQPTTTSSHIVIVFVNEADGSSICSPSVEQDLIKLLQIKGHWDCEGIYPGAHGFSVLYLWSINPTLTPDMVSQLRDEILVTLAEMAEAGKLPPVKASTIWQSPDGEPDLLVDFRYKENRQVCTGSISKSYWDARAALDLTDEEAFLLFYGDIEIEADYGSTEIDILDVMLKADRDFYS